MSEKLFLEYSLQNIINNEIEKISKKYENNFITKYSKYFNYIKIALLMYFSTLVMQLVIMISIVLIIALALDFNTQAILEKQLLIQIINLGLVAPITEEYMRYYISKKYGWKYTISLGIIEYFTYIIKVNFIIRIPALIMHTLLSYNYKNSVSKNKFVVNTTIHIIFNIGSLVLVYAILANNIENIKYIFN